MKSPSEHVAAGQLPWVRVADRLPELAYPATGLSEMVVVWPANAENGDPHLRQYSYLAEGWQDGSGRIQRTNRYSHWCLIAPPDTSALAGTPAHDS